MHPSIEMNPESLRYNIIHKVKNNQGVRTPHPGSQSRHSCAANYGNPAFRGTIDAWQSALRGSVAPEFELFRCIMLISSETDEERPYAASCA